MATTEVSADESTTEKKINQPLTNTKTCDKNHKSDIDNAQTLIHNHNNAITSSTGSNTDHHLEADIININTIESKHFDQLNSPVYADSGQEIKNGIEGKDGSYLTSVEEKVVSLDGTYVPQASQQVIIVSDDSKTESLKELNRSGPHVDLSPEPDEHSVSVTESVWSIDQEHSYKQKANKSKAVDALVEKMLLEEQPSDTTVGLDLVSSQKSLNLDHQSGGRQAQPALLEHSERNVVDHCAIKTIPVPQVLKIQTAANKYYIHGMNEAAGAAPKYLTLQGGGRPDRGVGSRKAYRTVQVLKLPTSSLPHPHLNSCQIDHNLKPLQIQHNLGLENKAKLRSVLRLEGVHLHYDDSCKESRGYYHCCHPSATADHKSPCQLHSSGKFFMKDGQLCSPRVADTFSHDLERVGTDAVYMDIAREGSMDLYGSGGGRGGDVVEKRHRERDTALDVYSLQNLSVDQYLPDFTDLPQFQNIPMDMEEERCWEPFHLTPSIPHNVIAYNWQCQQQQQHPHQQAHWYGFPSGPYPPYSTHPSVSHQTHFSTATQPSTSASITLAHAITHPAKATILNTQSVHKSPAFPCPEAPSSAGKAVPSTTTTAGPVIEDISAGMTCAGLASPRNSAAASTMATAAECQGQQQEGTTAKPAAAMQQTVTGTTLPVTSVSVHPPMALTNTAQPQVTAMSCQHSALPAAIVSHASLLSSAPSGGMPVSTTLPSAEEHVVSVTTLLPFTSQPCSVSQPTPLSAASLSATSHISSAIMTALSVEPLNSHNMEVGPVVESGIPRIQGGVRGKTFTGWEESEGMVGEMGCSSTFLSPPPSVEQVASQSSTPCPTESNESGYMTMEDRDLHSPGKLYWHQQQHYQDGMMADEAADGSGYGMMNSHVYHGMMGCGGDYYGGVSVGGMGSYPYTHQDSQYQTLHQTATDCVPPVPSSVTNSSSGSEVIYYPFNDLMQLHPNLMSGGEHDLNIQYVDPADPYSQTYPSSQHQAYSQSHQAGGQPHDQQPTMTKRRGRGGRPRGSRNSSARSAVPQIQSDQITSSLQRQMQQQVKMESPVPGVPGLPQKRQYRRKSLNPDGTPQQPKRRPSASRPATQRSSSADSQEEKGAKGRHNEPLNQQAVNIMYDWYRKHEDNPYPSKEEKEEMARDGGITTMQVKSWFANKRNRSNNTRPKVQKRAMEEKLLQIYNRLSKTQSLGGEGGGSEEGNSFIIKELSQIISNRFEPDLSSAVENAT